MNKRDAGPILVTMTRPGQIKTSSGQTYSPFGDYSMWILSGFVETSSACPKRDRKRIDLVSYDLMSTFV